MPSATYKTTEHSITKIEVHLRELFLCFQMDLCGYTTVDHELYIRCLASQIFTTELLMGGIDPSYYCQTPNETLSGLEKTKK
jgi:hypothetical protein